MLLFFEMINWLISPFGSHAFAFSKRPPTQTKHCESKNGEREIKEDCF